MSNPITASEKVVVEGKYFVFQRDRTKRFLIRGIAFPLTPFHNPYDVQGWIQVLEQIREASSKINTIRLYQIAPNIDYSEFLVTAADMGFYLIVPLTPEGGAGVLNRDLLAPNCYSEALYHFGTNVIQTFEYYPNIIGYVLEN